MEIKGGHSIKKHTCFHEFIGTALLMFSINAAKDSPFHVIGFCTMLFSVVCFTGPICGAHLNPATTISVMVVDLKKKPIENAFYGIYYILS